MNGKDEQAKENAPPAEKTRRRDPANPFIGAVLAHAWDDRALALEIGFLILSTANQIRLARRVYHTGDLVLPELRGPRFYATAPSLGAHPSLS